MRNLNKLGVIFGTGAMSALIFSVAACGEDPAPAPTGGTAGAAGAAAGSPPGGGGAGGSSSGSGGGGTGGAKAGAGGGGAGGGGAGGKAGSGGGGAGGGGAGGGGAGGGGGAPSAACKMLCEGADSIVMVCAAQPIEASLKASPTCLTRCGKSMAADITCWQMHTGFAKATPAMVAQHCGHAAGESNCEAWPD